MPKKHSGSLCLPDAWTLRGSALSPLEVRGGGGEEVVPSAWLPQDVPLSLSATSPDSQLPADSGCRDPVAGAGGSRPQGRPELTWPS